MMSKIKNKQRTCSTLALASTLTLLGACSSSDDNNVGLALDAQAPTPDFCNVDTPPDMQTPNPPLTDNGPISYGYAFTRGPNFGSGQIERISLTDGNIIDGTYPSTKSDHRLATDGTSVFQIGRFDIDNLTKFSAVDTSGAEYQLSLLNPGASTTNPQSLTYVDDNFAYLTRRSSDSLLVVDPTPEPLTTEGLIRGEISLAAYNRGSGDTLDLPDMTDAVLVDDKLFVLLENLDGISAPVESGYLAVFDACTNLEIPTGQGESPLQGIQLQTVNPGSLQYNESTKLLYVAGRGNYFADASAPEDRFTGGIVSIDPTTFENTLLIDDGTEDENNGFYINIVVIDDSLGYAITLDGYDANFNSISNLRTFNPATGEVSEPIAGTEGQDLTTLAVGPDNHLWVGIQDNAPGFIRIDLTTGVPAQERVRTNLIPADVLFLEVDG